MNSVATRTSAMLERSTRMALAAALFAALVCGLLSGCSSVPIPPTYTQAELRARCEMRGGVWHDDDLMGGFCEYQTARLIQAP
jgi:hypothetical protein